MKAILIFSILGLFLCGCSADDWADDWYGYGYTNRKNLNKIEIGITKAEILEIMGRPHIREASNQQEWWLYEIARSIYITDYERYTPIVFENGKVIGWGRNFYKDIPKEYDIKIDQRIKQE